MQSFSISYDVYVENYFEPTDDVAFSCDQFETGISDGKAIDLQSDDEVVLAHIQEIRSIIKKDFINILESRIKYLNNNKRLLEEFKQLIETIDNRIEFDAHHGNNFLFLTDNYLCFNNYENYVDEFLLGALGSEAETYETIVIIDVHFKKFYFVRITRKMLVEAESTTINAFEIKDNNVKQRKVNLKSGVKLTEHNDVGIEKVLSLLAKP